MRVLYCPVCHKVVGGRDIDSEQAADIAADHDAMHAEAIEDDRRDAFMEAS